MPRPVIFLDLYCGAGGYTTGFAEAMHELCLEYREIAINHCPQAIETMRRNHPDARVLQMDIEVAMPDDIDSDVIDLLHASPSCTHHSRAKGGKPRSDQLRSQPNEIWKFIDNKHVRRVTIENVPEFVNWGPLTADGRPIKRKMGDCFEAWLNEFKARGYTYEWRILNCADYGDATSRRRFFLQAVKHGCGKIRWPEPEYAENPQPDLFGHELKRWRGVNECLDYSDMGKSIFGRRNPLAVNTLRRVAIGLRKYCGIDFQVDMLGAGENVADPLTTVTTSGNHHALCTPFIMNNNENNVPRPCDKPLVTLTTGNHAYLCQPFIVKMRNNQDCAKVDEPLSAIACSGAHHELCNAMIVEITNNGRARQVTEPIGTQTSKDHFALVQSFVLGQQGGATLRPDNEPCPTIATGGAVRKVDVAILDMSRPGGNDSGHVRSAEQPLQTLTTCDNVQGVFAVLDDGRLLDVRIRMLKPSELAAAHSFPADYKLAGNRADQVRQIGNSVPVRTAKAIVKAMFRDLAA